MTQGGALIALLSENLSHVQHSYPVIKLKLLFLVKTLKVIYNFIAGCEVSIFTFHDTLIFFNLL